MRYECLVLASDIPAFKEIYKDAAVIFDPLAVDSLHATIREVLTEKKTFGQYLAKGKRKSCLFFLGKRWQNKH